MSSSETQRDHDNMTRKKRVGLLVMNGAHV